MCVLPKENNYCDTRCNFHQLITECKLLNYLDVSAVIYPLYVISGGAELLAQIVNEVKVESFFFFVLSCLVCPGLISVSLNYFSGLVCPTLVSFPLIL